MLERDSDGGRRARTPRCGLRAPAACARTRSPTRSGAPARASCTPTTSTRRSAPRRSRRRKAAGARVVLHLHNYRLVCAVGTCFTQGEDCTRCHGRNTLPGLRLNCRGGSRAESAAYAAGLALHQQRLIARRRRDRRARARSRSQRLRDLGAPLGDKARVLGSVQRDVRDALDRRRRRVRARRRPPDAREGLRRRRRRVRPRPSLPLVSPATARSARELEARGRRRALRRPVPRRRARRAARAGRRRRRPEPLRRDPAARRAGGDGRRRCRRSRRARAGSPRPCPRRACTRRATSRRSPQRLKRLYGDARGRRARARRRPRPQRARGHRRRSSTTLYDGVRNFDRHG